MNLLSGTTYKGATLRIAPARPNYLARLALERAAEPQASTSSDPADEAEEASRKKRLQRLRRISRRMSGIEGYEADDMQVMTKERLQKAGEFSGWKKDPVTGLPIFPIIARPLRPLPASQPSKADPTTGEGTPSSPSPRPPNRARRVRIDPTQYGPSSSISTTKGKGTPSAPKRHLVGPREVTTELYRLGYGGGAKAGKDRASRTWKCEERDGEVVWTLNDGEAEETVSLRRKASAQAPNTSSRQASASPVHTEIPLHLRHPSKPTEHSAPSPSDLALQIASERRSHLALLSALGGSSDNDAALEDVHEGLRAAVERQKAREGARRDGRSWMEDAGIEVVAPIEPERSVQRVTAYESDEDEDGTVLRLRGGAAETSSSEDTSEDGSDDSTSSSDDSSKSSSEDEAAAPPAASATSSATLDIPINTATSSSTDEDIPASLLLARPPSSAATLKTSKPKSTEAKLEMKSLTNMFEAQPESSKGGFTLFGADSAASGLFDGMDIDLGEDPLETGAVEVDERPSTRTTTAPIHPSRLAALRSDQPAAPSASVSLLPSTSADEEPLFFPYPYDDDEYNEGGILWSLGIKKGDARDEDRRKRCRFHAVPEGKELLGWKTFYRNETLCVQGSASAVHGADSERQGGDHQGARREEGPANATVQEAEAGGHPE